MRRVFTVAIVALLVIANPSLTSATGVIDEQYSLVGIGGGIENTNKMGVVYEENVDILRIPSFLFSFEQKVTPRSSDFTDYSSFDVLSTCTGLDDPACATANFVKYYAHMPPCKTSIEVDCIESIYAIAPGSSARIDGIFKESIPNAVARPYQARPEIGLPQGSVSGVWEIPNVKHGGGSSNFAAIVSQVGSLKRNGTSWIAQPAGSDIHNNGDFRAAIFPVNIVRDSRYKSIIADIAPRPDGTSGWITIGDKGEHHPEFCALVGEGVCAQRQSFPDEIKFGMVLRFSKVISGWMHGRVDSPEIDYELTNYGTRVDIKGYSTRVPILAGFATRSEFSDGDSKQIAMTEGQTVFGATSGAYAIQSFNIWAKALKDKAVANPTQWTLYNLSQRDIATSSSCIKESKTLAGFVTTNSTTYTATPPIFNSSTGTLDYKVASPHYLADGKEFLGKYHLYIDSKVARCIYKFTDAPVSASVSITSSDGGQQSIATTVVNEKDGWIILSALGFTFSSPTLKVKLTQSSPAVAPAPSAKPTAIPDPAPKVGVALVAKKKVISCVKGKVTKKISATSPKCPAGYKKK